MLKGTETQRNRKIHRFGRIFTRMIPMVLSISVVLATAYTLIQPGLTMTNDDSVQIVQTGDVLSGSEPTTESSATQNPVVETIPETDATETEAAMIEESTALETAPAAASDATSDSSLPADAIPETSGEITGISQEVTTSATVVQPREFIFDNEIIHVTAILDALTSLPDDAVFSVMEITAISDPARYENFVTLLEASADASDTTIPTGAGLLAYDIGFFVNGEEVEPTGGSVAVTITYKDTVIETETPDDISIFHVLETDETITLEPVGEIVSVVNDIGSVESISFETESFSAFLINPSNYTMNSALTYLSITNKFTDTSYYDPSIALGVAGNFHITAFNNLTLKAHTNGNILAKNLWAQANFGTNGLGTEVSYVQNYHQVMGNSSFDHYDILVIGTINEVSLVDNGNHFAIKGTDQAFGTQINEPYIIWQEANTALTPFIDIAALQESYKTTSSKVAQLVPTTNYINHLSTMNDRYVQLSQPDGVAVINMTAAQIMSYSEGFSVRGFETGKAGTVIINVDCAGQTTVDLPHIWMWRDGVKLALKELTEFSTGRVILNFVNSTNVTLNFKETYASILAPEANVVTALNVNGTIIGKNVTVNGGETHRTDFTGTLPLTGSVSATKAWLSNTGIPLTQAEVVDMSVRVQLYCNGAAMTGTDYQQTLNATNLWTYKWNNLPIGTNQKYTVKEVSISKAGTVIQNGDNTQRYAVTYTNNAGISDGNITITNTKVTGDISVLKQWTAFDGTPMTGTALDGMSVLVQLYSNGVAMTGAAYQQTLNAANLWTYKWADLPIGANQKYSVKEVSISKDGTVIQTGDVTQLYAVTYANNAGVNEGAISITNKKVTGDISVVKQWTALDGTPLTGDAISGMSVLVQLYSNGVAMTGAEYQKTLNAANLWTYKWTNLPISSNQKYTVKEVSISKDGTVIQTGDNAQLYSVTYTNNGGIADGSIIVVNKVNTGTITVEKKWYDNDGFPMNPSDTSGLAVTVQLFCNGTAMTGPPYTVTLNAAGNWTYTWTGLPIDTGQVYSVQESDYGGYSVTYDNNAGIQNGTVTVKNSQGHKDVLPHTGSIGTDWFYRIGASVMLVTSLLIYIRYRIRKKRREEFSG